MRIEKIAAIESQTVVVVAATRYSRDTSSTPSRRLHQRGVDVSDESSSFHVILSEAHRVLDVQRSHVEALETRAGIVLGFAGTLVALVDGHDTLESIGRALAATAALIALLGFLSGWIGAINPTTLQSRYGGEALADTTKGLIGFHGRIFLLAERLIRNKTRRLRTATGLLVAAVFFVAAGGGR